MNQDLIQGRTFPSLVSPSWRVWLAPFIIFVVAVLAYIPSMQAGFIWDDNYALWQNALNYQKDGLFKFWFTTEAPDYWPLTSTVFWIEWQFWGANPLGYHLQNILLHAFNAILLWLLLRRLSLPGAWIGALLFAVHPVNVATVAWISELKNTLSMLFLLPSLLFYVNFHETQKKTFYGLSLVFFLLAMLAKTSIAGVPLMLLAYCWWKQNGRITKQDVLSSLPFFLLSGILCGVTIWFHLFSTVRSNAFLTLPENFAARLAGAGWAVWFYLYKTLLPFNLSIIYPYWKVPWQNPLAYLPGIAIVASLVLFWRYRTGWGRHALFAAICFLALIFPVLGFVNMSYMMHSLVADHFQYIPILAPLAAASAIAGQMIGTLGGRRRILAITLATAAVCTLGGLTAERAWIFRGHIPLWRYTIEKNPSAWMAYYHLGTELALEAEQLYNTGQTERARAVCLDAAHWLTKGASLRPDYYDTLNNLGLVLTRLGRLDEGIAWYSKALTHNKNDLNANLNMANALKEKGNLPEALVYYNNVLQLTGGRHIDALFQVGFILLQAQNAADAAKGKAMLEQLAASEPRHVGALLALGKFNLAAGKREEAYHYFAAAFTVPGAPPQDRKMYAEFLAQLNRLPEAADQYTILASLTPNDVDVRSNLGYLMILKGQQAEAFTHLQAAVALGPKHLGALNNLGLAYETVGNLKMAAEYYRRALEVDGAYKIAKVNLARVTGKAKSR